MATATAAARGDSLDACCQLLALSDGVVRRTRREAHTKTTLDVIGVLADSVTTATLMSADSVEAVRARDKLSGVLKTLRDADALACHTPAADARRAQLVAQLEGQLHKRH